MIYNLSWKGDTLAKTNFGYEKRQRELAQKKKKEDKLKRKQEKNAVPADADGVLPVEGDSGTVVSTPADEIPASP